MIYTPAGNVVRSWRENLIRESRGIPPLMVVGGKAIEVEGYLANLAVAVDLAIEHAGITVRTDTAPAALQREPGATT